MAPPADTSLASGHAGEAGTAPLSVAAAPDAPEGPQSQPGAAAAQAGLMAPPPSGLADRLSRGRRQVVDSAMLALIALVGRVRTLSLRRRGFCQHFVKTSKGPVAVLEAKGAGTGPTWVFFHGFASRASDWHD
ncbi:MAG: hypothetical protein EOO40_06045, partial [Deltaproteobacteria bacterium]